MIVSRSKKLTYEEVLNDVDLDQGQGRTLEYDTYGAWAVALIIDSAGKHFWRARNRLSGEQIDAPGYTFTHISEFIEHIRVHQIHF